MYTSTDAAENFDDIFKNSESALRYKQILPTLITSVLINLFSKLEFIPEDFYTLPWRSTPIMKSWRS